MRIHEATGNIRGLTMAVISLLKKIGGNEFITAVLLLHPSQRFPKKQLNESGDGGLECQFAMACPPVQRPAKVPPLPWNPPAHDLAADM